VHNSLLSHSELERWRLICVLGASALLVILAVVEKTSWSSSSSLLDMLHSCIRGWI
jgi:hypothetical protein